MENPILNHPFKDSLNEDNSKKGIDTEYLNEHVRMFIEELTKGATPQEAARHSENFKNTTSNYRLEKARHSNPWK